MKQEPTNSSAERCGITGPRPNDRRLKKRRLEDYLYPVATIVAALLLVLSATV